MCSKNLVLQRPRDKSKRVAMPNLFEVYCILIDAHIDCFPTKSGVECKLTYTKISRG